MLRKLSETFTATHFTILVGIVVLAPGALYATVATTAVSITDPNVGRNRSSMPRVAFGCTTRLRDIKTTHCINIWHK